MTKFYVFCCLAAVPPLILAFLSFHYRNDKRISDFCRERMAYGAAQIAVPLHFLLFLPGTEKVTRRTVDAAMFGGLIIAGVLVYMIRYRDIDKKSNKKRKRRIDKRKEKVLSNLAFLCSLLTTPGTILATLLIPGL